MTIQEITLIVSAVSAIAAVAGAVIALLVYLRSNAVDPPKLTVTITGGVDGYSVNISAKNWSTQTWSATEAEVLRPRAAKIVSKFDVTKSDGGGGVTTNDETINWAIRTNKCKMHLKVAPAGQSSRGVGLIMGQSDSAHERLLLSVPGSIRSRKLSIRLSLVSNDAVQRAKTIAIKRTLPAAVKTAKD